MAAKLRLLVAVALGISALASIGNDSGNDSGQDAKKKILMMDLEKALLKLTPETADLNVDALEKAATALRPVAPHGESAGTETLEAAVTDLVMSKAQAAFGATPFGDTVQRIVDLIEGEMFPKVLDAFKADQYELDHLGDALKKCGTTKAAMIGVADKSKEKYLKFSPLHKTCRTGQAGLLMAKQEACSEMLDKEKYMQLKKTTFDLLDAKLKDQEANKQIMQKEGSEATESYLDRISATICGQDDAPMDIMSICHPDGPGGGGSGGGSARCGTPQCGFRCQFQCAKTEWENAASDYDAWTAKCKAMQDKFDAKVIECDNLQNQMDAGACKRAVDMKDACETYAECYTSKKQAYEEAEVVIRYGEGGHGEGEEKGSEHDRFTEWRGLKRMQCLMSAFADGKVDDAEIEHCKKREYSIDHLKIKYPDLPPLDECHVPKLYPTTGEYKKAEFAPLPALAKGKEDANECTGVLEISLTPAAGSPATCKCERVTMNGPYSPGPVVKCLDCLDVRKSTDKISCPAGTKLWSPRSRDDWKTFLASAEALRAPNWIVDITRPLNGCGGCADQAMNSRNEAQADWQTSDGAPWWLRSTGHSGGGGQPTSDYHANCFLDLWHEGHPTAGDEDMVTFASSKCDYHSSSYYCQLESYLVTPKPGSPLGCRCKKVELTGIYSPGILIKCMGCLDVKKSTEKNSCPVGSKIFAPRTREDWKVFIDSATPLRAPNWIIDVTRPANGCGGCAEAAMNSDNLAQKTWRTSDGAAWWLRSTSYTEPSGDYEANCYLDLWHNPENENSVAFNDMSCNYHSNSYYCQLARKVEEEAPVA